MCTNGELPFPTSWQLSEPHLPCCLCQEHREGCQEQLLWAAQGERSQQSPAPPHRHWRGITSTGNYILFSPAPVKAVSFLTSLWSLTSTTLPLLTRHRSHLFCVTLQMLTAALFHSLLLFSSLNITPRGSPAQKMVVLRIKCLHQEILLFSGDKFFAKYFGNIFSLVSLFCHISPSNTSAGAHHSVKLGMQSLTIFSSGEKVDSPFQNLISTGIYCQANLHWHK